MVFSQYSRFSVTRVRAPARAHPPPARHPQTAAPSRVASMSGKRSASDAVGEPESSETSKRCRLRSAVDESLTHLVCAITQELPLDPVTAEDGNIYERSAIEEWLSRQQKSPMTNQPMGTKLLPAFQIRSMIETMVRSGGISGEMATSWQKRLEEERRSSQPSRRRPMAAMWWRWKALALESRRSSWPEEGPAAVVPLAERAAKAGSCRRSGTSVAGTSLGTSRLRRTSPRPSCSSLRQRHTGTALLAACSATCTKLARACPRA